MGSEKNKLVTKSFLKGFDAVIILVSPINYQIEILEKWYKEVRKHNRDTVVFVASTENDLVTDCTNIEEKKKYEQNLKEIKSFARHVMCRYVATSSKTGLNVDETMFAVVKRVYLSNQGKYTKIWEPQSMEDEIWGHCFRSFVILVLMVHMRQKKEKKGVLKDIPKPIVILFVSMVSEIYLQEQNFDEIEQYKPAVKGTPQEESNCLIF